MIDIEPIAKLSGRYKEMLRMGILVSQFTGTYDMKQGKWRLDFILTRRVTGAELKDALLWYTRTEYEATEHEFFMSKKNPDSIGCVKFYRGDL